MPFNYNVNLSDTNDAIPNLINSAVSEATDSLERDIISLEMQKEDLKFRVAELENSDTVEPTPTPTPTPTYTPNNSGGSGGAFSTQRYVPYAAATDNYGTVSSYFHLDAAHIDKTKPIGILFHLHGDGAEEYDSPNNAVVTAYRQIAIDNNFIFVVPRTPDTVGSSTWWENPSSAEYLIDLWMYFAVWRYNVDLNRVYWSGYSGGAEVLTYDILANYTNLWTGGGAQMLGGGGAYSSQYVKAPSTSLKAHFPLQWVVGSDDDGSTSYDDFDAISAANSGKQRYANAGFTTNLVTIPSDDHYESEDNGPTELRKFIANTIWK